jgi:hypothetical protein
MERAGVNQRYSKITESALVMEELLVIDPEELQDVELALGRATIRGSGILTKVTSVEGSYEFGGSVRNCWIRTGQFVCVFARIKFW